MNVLRFQDRLIFMAHRLCVSLNSVLESEKEEDKEVRGACCAISSTSQEAHPLSEAVPGKAGVLTHVQSKHTSLVRSAIAFGQVQDAIACPGPTLEATQGKISGQSRTDTTRFWQQLNGN